jgi:hypothetical protein
MGNAILNRYALHRAQAVVLASAAFGGGAAMLTGWGGGSLEESLAAAGWVSGVAMMWGGGVVLMPRRRANARPFEVRVPGFELRVGANQFELRLPWLERQVPTQPPAGLGGATLHGVIGTGVIGRAINTPVPTGAFSKFLRHAWARQGRLAHGQALSGDYWKNVVDAPAWWNVAWYDSSINILRAASNYYRHAEGFILLIETDNNWKKLPMNWQGVLSYTLAWDELATAPHRRG